MVLYETKQHTVLKSLNNFLKYIIYSVIMRVIREVKMVRKDKDVTAAKIFSSSP